MKFVFLFGGAAGFAAGALASYGAGRAPDRVLLDGAVGCLAGALLFRWCWSILLRGIRETYLERQRVSAETTAAAASAEAAAFAKAAPDRTSAPALAAPRSRIP